LRELKEWSEATKKAKGWLEFHRSSPSSANNDALIEIALLWQGMAEAKPRDWAESPYKSRQEFLAAANEQFEEVLGKASDTTAKSFGDGHAYIAGNWGTVLMHLANLTKPQDEAKRIQRDSAHLFEIAIETPPKDERWQLNRIYLEGFSRKRDPTGFAAYCDGLKPTGKSAVACGRVLNGLVKAGHSTLPAAETEHLACQAARWAGQDAEIQKGCDQARQRMRRRNSP
jgi:hypothetical protein